MCDTKFSIIISYYMKIIIEMKEKNKKKKLQKKLIQSILLFGYVYTKSMIKIKTKK